MISKLSLMPKNRNFSLMSFEAFLNADLSKNCLECILERLFEPVCLVTKIFFGANSEKSHEYIFEKNL